MGCYREKILFKAKQKPSWEIELKRKLKRDIKICTLATLCSFGEEKKINVTVTEGRIWGWFVLYCNVNYCAG